MAVILGLGTDLCSIERMEAVLSRQSDRFLMRCFTPGEIALAQSRPALRAATLAKRWAAKEACAKALGTGIGRGFGMTDIEVVLDDLGAPSLILHHGAAQRLAAITPQGHEAFIHLSLTDEMPWAQATVILEGRTKVQSDETG